MKKKLAAGVLSVVLLVGGATVAFGAGDSDKFANLKVLLQKNVDIQKQIVAEEEKTGRITPDQAKKQNEFIGLREQSMLKALDDGKPFGQGLRKGMDKGMVNKGMIPGKAFNNGQPMTVPEADAWLENAKARLAAKVKAMEKDSKLEPKKLEDWKAAAEAQLEKQAKEMKDGTFVPGNMGNGMRGNPKGGTFGGKMIPKMPATTNN